MRVSQLDLIEAEAAARVRARRREATSGCAEHPTWREELAVCLGVGSVDEVTGTVYEARRPDFVHFCRHWKFKNRDTSRIIDFKNLWPGQERLAAAFRRAEDERRWVFALKAGKLGFTELACAYDGWVMLTRRRSRVHLFSRDLLSAMELMGWVKFGLTHLPTYFGVETLRGERGGDTGRSIKVRVSKEAGSEDAEDVRQIVAYAAGATVSIDQVATHSHVDEMSHMPFPEATWGAVSTTVAPGDEELGIPPGTLHIITRGAGDQVYTADLWHQAMEGRWGQKAIDEFVAEHPDETPPELYTLMPGAVAASQLNPVFAPWWERAGRDRQWYETQKMSMHAAALSYFAPETPDDALAGELDNIYIPPDLWMARRDQYLVDHPLEWIDESGELQISQDAIVLSLDAGVSGDNFGLTATSRHPLDLTRPAIRAVRKWVPPSNGQIDYEDVQRFVRWICQGGCLAGHPLKWVFTPPREDYPSVTCEACQFIRDGGRPVPKHNVVQLTFDMYQLAEMVQQFEADHLCWCDAFDQNSERLIADGFMHSLVMNGRLTHNGDPDLLEHISNAKAKLEADQESKMRIVKRSDRMKIDLAVAASMGVKRVMDLNLA